MRGRAHEQSRRAQRDQECILNLGLSAAPASHARFFVSSVLLELCEDCARLLSMKIKLKILRYILEIS